jgi:purine-binding chemotaxis protein CheW
MFRDGAARLLVFRVGSERFGLSISDVDEVMDAQVVHRLPDAPATVLGVASIRGELITVYDPRPLLRAGGPASLNAAMLVFVRGDRRVALAIDDVFDPVVVAAHELLAMPSGTDSDGILIGVIRRESELIAVCDTGALLDAAMEVPEGERT